MTAQNLRTATSRRAARNPRVSRLIAADASSSAELQALVATLPLCTTGRIFIEVADASEIGVLDAPPQMTVTWLDRSRRTGETGSGRACAAGQALSRAVNAWADEMLCDDDTAADTRVHLLTGYLASADIFDHLTERLGVDAERIDAPAQYRLVNG